MHFRCILKQYGPRHTCQERRDAVGHIFSAADVDKKELEFEAKCMTREQYK